MPIPADSFRFVLIRADLCRFVPNHADSCRFVRVRAESCGTVPARADSCRSVRADWCGLVRTPGRCAPQFEFLAEIGLDAPAAIEACPAFLGSAGLERRIRPRQGRPPRLYQFPPPPIARSLLSPSASFRPPPPIALSLLLPSAFLSPSASHRPPPPIESPLNISDLLSHPL